MKQKFITFLVLLLTCSILPLNTYAVMVNSGDIIKIEFDLSAETPAPPYDGIYTTLYFGSSDYLNSGEGMSIAIFDNDGTGLADGTGYYLLYDIVGSFDLTSATAAGRFYTGSSVTDSTDYISGVISSLALMPDLSDSLLVSGSTIYSNNSELNNIASLGIDHLLLAPPVGVSEPITLLLFASGLLGLGMQRRRRFH